MSQQHQLEEDNKRVGVSLSDDDDSCCDNDDDDFNIMNNTHRPDSPHSDKWYYGIPNIIEDENNNSHSDSSHNKKLNKKKKEKKQQHHQQQDNNNNNNNHYALTMGMMIGIRECVGSKEPELAASLMEELEKERNNSNNNNYHGGGSGSGSIAGSGSGSSNKQKQRYSPRSTLLKECNRCQKIFIPGKAIPSVSSGLSISSDSFILQQQQQQQSSSSSSFTSRPSIKPIPSSSVTGTSMSSSTTASSFTNNHNNEGGVRSNNINSSKRRTSFSSRRPSASKNNHTEYNYEFKAYAPIIFANIRSFFRVDKQLFLHSICGIHDLKSFNSNAKSGSFFFFTKDKQYMIKTLSDEETIFLKRLLPYYYVYVKQNPNTLLSHFYGMYRVKTLHVSNNSNSNGTTGSSTDQQRTLGQAPIKKQHFVIIKSVFAECNNTKYKIYKTYDLKGSTKGRISKENESVLKDLNIINEKRKLYFSSTRGGSGSTRSNNGKDKELKKEFINQLRSDATFLARQNIMDYSILLGIAKPIVNNNNNNEENEKEKGEVELCLSSSVSSSSSPSSSQSNNKSQQGKVSSSRSLNDSIEIIPTTTTTNATKSNNSNDKTADTIATSSEDEIQVKNQEQQVTTNKNEDDEEKKTTNTSSSSSTILDGISRGIRSRRCRNDDDYDNDEIYYLGIIDILQQYNTRKWGETITKRTLFGNSKNEISCIDPESYANRFVSFITSLIE